MPWPISGALGIDGDGVVGRDADKGVDDWRLLASRVCGVSAAKASSRQMEAQHQSRAAGARELEEAAPLHRQGTPAAGIALASRISWVT